MRKVMILGGTGLIGKCFLIWKNKKELVNSLRIWTTLSPFISGSVKI